MRTFLAATAFAVAMLNVHAGAASDDDRLATIKAIEDSTKRFEDVKAALAEGYVPDPSGHCVTAEAEGLPASLGGMGIHYLRPDLLGISATEPRVDGTGTHTDIKTPAILLYQPQKDGSLKLVGAEWLVFKKSWEAAGNKEPPDTLGRKWDLMADDPATPADEAHGFEPHYDQHVYFVGDPERALEPFNPAVTCEHHSANH